jgi:hypothetical protein
MVAGFDLIERAAAGSSAAQLGLVNEAIEAGASGMVPQFEALAAAETWARIAAARGGVEENRALVGVLLARGEFEIGRGVIYNAQWYEGEARRILRLLIALDDDDARHALATLGDEIGEHHEPDPQVHRNLLAAAGGDLDALASLYDEALGLMTSGQSDPIEAMTAGELYARLGSAGGDAGHMRKLAGILLKRAEYEYETGRPAVADNAVTEATVLLSILVDTGDGSMATWLGMLVNDSVRPAIAKAIQHRPTILKFIEPEGNC